jgi:virginiamycin B lyase
VVETGVQPNRFVGFDPKSLTFLEPAPIPSGAGTVRHMVFEPRGNAVWFATDAHTVGRARLP